MSISILLSSHHTISPSAPKRRTQNIKIPKPLQTSRLTRLRPSMADFVGPKSHLCFDRLNLSEGYLEWMFEECRRIHTTKLLSKSKYQSYNKLCDHVQAQLHKWRGWKLLQDNLQSRGRQIKRMFFSIIYLLFQLIVNWWKGTEQKQIYPKWGETRNIGFSLNFLKSINTGSLGGSFKIKD